MVSTLKVLTLLLVAGGAIAQERYSAKSLFFAADDSVVAAATGVEASPLGKSASADPPAKKSATLVALRKPVAPKQIGASYFIRLKNNDGSSRDVLASRKFKTGEHFQLGVKVNRPTYVYILNEDPDGKVTQIYPQQGHSNFIDAMGTVFLPSKGSFEFDDKPGMEQLLVYLSPTPILENMTDRVRKVNPDMVSVVAEASSRGSECLDVLPAMVHATKQQERIELASAEIGYASKGIGFKGDAVSNCSNVQQAKASTGYASKGILFSDDAEPSSGGQVASYVVKKVDVKSDKNLYLKIKLHHE